MNATIISHRQGSPEWAAHRARSLNASELSAAMGLSSYITRSSLIQQKSTGIAPEVDAATQYRFNKGHEFEAIARPWAEEIIGEDLYPVVLACEVDGLPLSASLDGQTMTGEVTWEHKSGKASLLKSLDTGIIPDEYHPQMEQGLMLSGANRCLFMASSGSRDTMRYAWYESNHELRARIIPTWVQFKADLAAWVPPASKAAPVVADAMESLPAVSVRLDGKLAVVSNLPDFTTALRAFIERIPAKPETDQDFANAESACKALKHAEDALTAGEDAALGEMVDFEAMRRQVRDLKDLARTTRLATEKLVAARKEQIRGEIVASGVARYQAHIESLNASLGRNYMSCLPVDFGGAVKGKRTVDSLLCAVNDELARAKIAANEVAQRIQTNLNTLREKAADHAFLFADTAALVQKEPEFVTLTVHTRISEHQKAEAARLEREREAIRSEEQARAQREAEATLQLEREAEAKRKLDAENAPGVAPAPAAAPAAPSGREDRPSSQDEFNNWRQSGAPATAHKPAEADTGSRVNLTAINEHFAPIQLTSVGLAQLGFEPVATVKASKLYRACDLPAMAAALISHLHALEAVPA